MKFKNFRATKLSACSDAGHSFSVDPFSEIELPEHMELFAIERGLVPMDDVEQIAAREAVQAKAEAAAKKKADADAAAAKKARAEALKKAAESATDAE